MDIRTIKKLIELVKESGIGEIEIHEGEQSIRVSLFSGLQPPQPVLPSPTQQITMPSPPIAHIQPAPEKAEKPEPAHKGHAVKSPMVGTVYLAPTQGAKPFVEIGQRVEAGHVLCLIEAMKMFNQIEADVSGVISARLIENEQPIEYDQPLFIIE
jgi:acetyl-CoA carboxylase biotin carboxyl carrier protein